jgi:hypothetical protein
MKPIRVKIGRQYWKVVKARLPRDTYGRCCYETRTITVRDGTTKAEMLATAIHEALHAERPDMTEAEVLSAEGSIMRVIKAYGLVDFEDD